MDREQNVMVGGWDPRISVIAILQFWMFQGMPGSGHKHRCHSILREICEELYWSLPKDKYLCNHYPRMSRPGLQSFLSPSLAVRGLEWIGSQGLSYTICNKQEIFPGKEKSWFCFCPRLAKILWPPNSLARSHNLLYKVAMLDSLFHMENPWSYSS